MMFLKKIKSTIPGPQLGMLMFWSVVTEMGELRDRPRPSGYDSIRKAESVAVCEGLAWHGIKKQHT